MGGGRRERREGREHEERRVGWEEEGEKGGRGGGRKGGREGRRKERRERGKVGGRGRERGRVCVQLDLQSIGLDPVNWFTVCACPTSTVQIERDLHKVTQLIITTMQLISDNTAVDLM